MNVLLIGSGGREHALAWAIGASPLLNKLFCAPGNAGIAEVATCVKLDTAEASAVIAFCRVQGIDFVVIGPEAPLVAGLGDALDAAGIKYFGPTKSAAQLEGSKGFTKDLCREFNIPTAAYGRFKDAASAKAFLAGQAMPIVVKADGLAAGKGVVIAATPAEAEAAIDACFAGAFGAAGAEVVVEEFLDGEEASFFALVDGTHALALATAQDHKRVGDGDTGPNTGGMGAYSPAPVMTEALIERTMAEIIRPTVAGMAARGAPFKGVLFAGLMITKDGPKLIEYNVRFGDPETQVLMMRLKSDVLAALVATADGVLSTFDVRWRDEVALTVVLAANGYPGTPEKGTEILGLDAARAVEGVEIFHAGTKRDGERIIADGGRVLNVTALGKTVADAQQRAYEAIAKIDWPGGFCRHDIGWRAVAREEMKMRVAMLGLMALLVSAMPMRAEDGKLPTTEPIRSAMTAIRDLTLTNHTLVTHRRMPPASAKKFRADINGHVALVRAAEAGLGAVAAKKIEEIASAIGTGADAVAGEGGVATPIDGILAIDAALHEYAVRFEHPGWQPLR